MQARNLTRGAKPGFNEPAYMGTPKIPSDFRPLGAAGSLNQYECAGAVFALLPGGKVTLGFSGNWKPTAEELNSWKETQEEYELPGSRPAEFITTVTTPVRTVAFLGRRP